LASRGGWGVSWGGGAPPPPPPLDIAPRAPPQPVLPVAPPPTLVLQPPPHPATGPTLPLTPAVDPLVRRRAPSVVVDLQSASGPPVAVSAATAVRPASAVVSAQAGGGARALPGGAVAALGSTLAAGAGQAGGLDTFGQFAARASEAPPPPAVATELGNLSTVITQGATIPGVLETAIDSDLPGYARAVVSRDVRSFDGKAVLIPRGSRLIGQYRGGVAQGQSRVFIIWTRVIRPDGVSIQIASPGADALGRAGAGGEVNTHFFTRFGGSILLSVLNAGIAAIGHTPSTQITIGSPAAAAGAVAGASIDTGANIGPTIKITQGQAINIFVSRDLDFSGVKAVK
jgi:type IV secretory pathway VirB10-like protein